MCRENINSDFVTPIEVSNLTPNPEDGKLALDPLLTVILGFERDTPKYQALLQFEINTVDDLLEIDPVKELCGIQFTYIDFNIYDNNEKQTTLPISFLKKLELLKDWYYEQEEQTCETWFTLSPTRFEHWKRQTLANRHRSF